MTHKNKRRGGRPRGARNRRTILKDIAAETHVIKVSGKRRRVSVGELLFMQLRQMAIKENPRAAAELERLMDKFAPQVMNGKFGILLVPEDATEEEVLAGMDALNAAADARHWALEREAQK